jgi:serine/threonine-protein kinase
MNAPSDLQALEEGRVVNGKWEIIEFIAKGGKGEVYLATQLNLDRKVALKVMSKEFLDSLEDRTEEYESELQRFRREVRVMARIRHPNVLQVFDFDQVQVDGTTLDYIAMEYVPGPTLRQTMLEEGFQKDEPAIAAWLSKYFFPVLLGMEAVHAKGVVHRDMKPENVLIDDEVPKIADFGLAGGHQLDDITKSFHVIGTPPYMPEEQFIDLATTDARTDVYSLGKILYEAIEGRMTQERNKPFESVQLFDPSTRMLRRLDKVVRNATSKDRHHRTSSVRALRKELEAILEESGFSERAASSRRHRKQLLITAGAGSFLILALLAAFGLHLLSMDSGPRSTQQQSRTEARGAEGLAFDFSSRSPTLLPDATKGEPLPEKIQGSDGMTMRLVPGGKATVAVDQPEAPDRRQEDRTLSVPSFYMDETKITNHLYVEFLRQIEGLVVRDGAVRRNGRVWLLLGEVLEGYEPIVYREGRFRIKAGAASNPVVRVTIIGALAYADFYGRDLPTMAQWKRAVEAGGGAGARTLSEGGPTESGGGMHHMMHGDQGAEAVDRERTNGGGIHSVTSTRAGRLRIHGLGRNVNEWTMAVSEEQEPEFHIHGGLGELASQGAYLVRQEWEAFARVGFRTVLNLSAEER